MQSRRYHRGTTGTRVHRLSGTPLLAVDASHPLSICLVSAHPGQLAAMERILAAPHFALSTLRLKLAPGEDPDRGRVPRASVYVIDASAPPATTEHVIERIRLRFPKARALVIKETLKDEKLFPHLRLGVRGAIRYADLEEDLPRAVHVVAAGGFWVSSPQLARFVDSILGTRREPLRGKEAQYLTPRERQVLMHVVQGLSNKEIGEKLHISERTVKFHVSRLFVKFKVRRRAELIRRHYPT